MSKFVWVEKESIDKDGEWLRVMKDGGERLLCERGDPFERDVWIEKSDVLQETDRQLF